MRQALNIWCSAYRPICWKMRPPDGGVHEHNVFVDGHIWYAVCQCPAKGSPVVTHIVVVNILCIGREAWQGPLRLQDILALHRQQAAVAALGSNACVLDCKQASSTYPVKINSFISMHLSVGINVICLKAEHVSGK